MASDDGSLRSLSLDYLNLLINGQAFSDVTFTVEGRLVHAHRCVLAARSPFFRRFFCGPEDPPTGPGVVHVNSVSYEVFMLVLQYLYSGHASVVPQRLEPGATCGDRACCHANCAAAFDLALETLSASRSFGVEQLALITQKQLEKMVEMASIEDVMKVLIASSNQESSSNQLWLTCSHLVANSGLPPQTLAKHLPPDIVARIENLRLKSSLPRHHHHHHRHHPTGGIDEKLHRMRRALDSADVELVRLMVMADGLDLDRSLALHYAVENCSREVVKALLELGLVDVNLPAGPTGQTPLHVAAEMVSPEMVAVLLDHHADPTRRAADGASPLDVLRALTSEFLLRGAGGGGRAAGLEPNKLRLCLELVQSAALVISREEERGGGEARGRSIYSRGHK